MYKFLTTYPPILTISDVAEILHVSSGTITKLIMGGRLNALKIGNRFRITKVQLVEFLNDSDNCYFSATPAKP